MIIPCTYFSKKIEEYLQKEYENENLGAQVIFEKHAAARVRAGGTEFATIMVRMWYFIKLHRGGSYCSGYQDAQFVGKEDGHICSLLLDNDVLPAI